MCTNRFLGSTDLVFDIYMCSQLELNPQQTIKTQVPGMRQSVFKNLLWYALMSQLPVLVVSCRYRKLPPFCRLISVAPFAITLLQVMAGTSFALGNVLQPVGLTTDQKCILRITYHLIHLVTVIVRSIFLIIIMKSGSFLDQQHSEPIRRQGGCIAS